MARRAVPASCWPQLGPRPEPPAGESGLPTATRRGHGGPTAGGGVMLGSLGVASNHPGPSLGHARSSSGYTKPSFGLDWTELGPGLNALELHPHCLN